jgi:glycosyltransferase involved in cell wall biosynthesis
VSRTSVVIPSFNYAEYLPASIESVLAQTDRDFELLIVDDGSTDGSLAVARSYSDPRVRVLVEPHRGIGPTHNVGMQAARGRYIAFLDADDIWARGKLAAQCELLDRCPDIGLVYTRYGVIAADGRVTSRGYSWLTPKPSGAILRQLLEGNVIGTMSSICFRRDLVEDQQLRFDDTETYSDDWHFYLRVAARTRVHYLPRTLAYHRQHARNTSGHVPTLMAQTLRTGRFGLDLARQQLGFAEPELRRIERRVLAYAEALVGREYLKAGNRALARAHAARSLSLQPWNIRGTVLYLLASIGWMPQVVTRHLK